MLKSLGATHVLNRFLAPSAIISSLKDITGGVPIEYVHDTVSIPDTQTLAYEALAPGGVLIVVLQDVIPAELKKDSNGKKIVNVAGNVHFSQNRQIGIEVYKRLTGWLRDGVIVVRTHACGSTLSSSRRMLSLDGGFYSRTRWKSCRMAWRVFRTAWRG